MLAALADDVTTAAQQAARLAFAILDGTLVPIDRIADQKPYYSGETSGRHGVNVQVLARRYPVMIEQNVAVDPDRIGGECRSDGRVAAV